MKYRFSDEIITLLDNPDWAVAKDENGKITIEHGYSDKRIKDRRSILVFYDTSKASVATDAFEPDFKKAHAGYNFIKSTILAVINAGTFI